MYQKCPKCDGTGKRFNSHGLTGIPMMDMQSIAFDGLVKLYEIKGMDNNCPVCNGKMIISTLNGTPPKD